MVRFSFKVHYHGFNPICVGGGRNSFILARNEKAEIRGYPKVVCAQGIESTGGGVIGLGVAVCGLDYPITGEAMRMTFSLHCTRRICACIVLPGRLPAL